MAASNILEFQIPEIQLFFYGQGSTAAVEPTFHSGVEPWSFREAFPGDLSVLFSGITFL
jgi:hypothetical protein